jgi:hypothetical protein
MFFGYLHQLEKREVTDAAITEMKSIFLKFFECQFSETDFERYTVENKLEVLKML